MYLCGTIQDEFNTVRIHTQPKPNMIISIQNAGIFGWFMLDEALFIHFFYMYKCLPVLIGNGVKEIKANF